ncbi:Uncharacterised protein [Candidatus Anstonella stagnisolia]|nr:Uncharacterised protein [Candidatus Anstonella stagnisolia]
MLPQPKQAKELFGIREIKQWAKPIMEYYGTLDSANCAGFAFAVCNKMLEKEGRINTEIASIRNAWRVKRNLNTKEFAKFDKKALFEVENGQQPQRFVKSSDGKLVYTALEEGQAQRIWNEMKNAPAGTMLTVLYSRTLTGAEQGRGEDEPSHVLVCAGNGRWADEIDHVVNVYDVNSMGGFRNFNEKFHFVEDSMMFRLKAEKFPSAPAKIEITADSLRFAVGKETVSPVKFAAAVR